MAKKTNQAKLGTNCKTFSSLAMQSKRIRSSIRIDIPAGYVLLEFIFYGLADEARVAAGYTFYHDENFAGKAPKLTEKRGRSTSSIGYDSVSSHYTWRDDSLENSLVMLIKDWPKGKPDFDSIQFESKASPAKKTDLEKIILAVWLETFGQEVPDESGLAKRVRSTKQKHKDLRAECLEWLQSGLEGVQKWNQLRVDQREAVGKLGKCNFSGCDLSGVRFSNQDLRGSDFRKANLQQARFGGTDCRNVNFQNANLTEAWLSGGKFLEANFSKACLREAAICGADCRGAKFSNADLSQMDLSFADLRNVNLSSANLQRADLFAVKYDEQTKFPKGFIIKPKLRMEWKGKKKRASEHKACCSLDELSELIPPPEEPLHTEGNWKEAEALTGIQFPDDFKELIETYGSGEILRNLEIFNPLTPAGRKNFASELEIMKEVRESREYLWAIHPEESGILPWGRDTNANIFCWITSGYPDQWICAQLDHNADEPEIDNVNITTFLYNYARNQYPEMLGGLKFKKSDYKFTSM